MAKVILLPAGSSGVGGVWIAVAYTGVLQPVGLNRFIFRNATQIGDTVKNRHGPFQSHDSKTLKTDNKKNCTMNTSTRLLAFALFLLSLPASAQDVPAQLPDPDGKPGDSSKPVKVYVLAGQSNMVGMGDLSGAKNIYTGVYFGSDPDLQEGPFQIYKVGNYKISILNLFLPNGTPTQKPLAEGWLEVPQSGKYLLQCGFGKSSFCTMHLDGNKVYCREKDHEPIKAEISLKAGTRYGFKISDFKGPAPRFWMQKTDLLGQGDLEAVAKRDGKFPWLVDGQGNWTVRNDVYFQEARLAKDGKGSPLSALSNGKSIGPELGFGHVLGTFHDEQVLLIKTAQGNRSLGFDFRPPSSGRTDADNEFESAEYRLMVEGVRNTLNKIDKVVPGYKGQGYEVSGFFWFQGHKDSFSEATVANYEQNLTNLINDVRKDFENPTLPVVVATVGFGGQNMSAKFKRILDAQMAVADPKRHKDFAGNVASVDVRDFWREVDESPANQDYHYNRNAETYMLIGDSLGRAMVRLQGGQAEPLPVQKRSKRRLSTLSNGSSDEATAALARKALQPIIFEGIAASYIENPRNKNSLLEEASGKRPQRPNQFLNGAMYGLLNCYHAAGISDFDWKPFGPDLNDVKWDYVSFDPPERLAFEKGNRFRKVTYPEGMENWVSADFDPSGAGFRKGLQPFGQLDGKRSPLSESCSATFCRCGEMPKTLWEKEVLMVRSTIQFPPIKKGHRYRIVVGGAAHVNSGEGYALYVNGKLLAESKAGVAVRQGGQPRGGHIYSDLLDEFNGGKVTIAAMSFLRYNHPRRGVEPPRGHFSLQIEEQKLPPALQSLDN